MPEPGARATPMGHPVNLRGWALPSLAGYQGRWLSRDVVAGLVLSALLVPQGMAYAELAGLPAVTGLYTSILCLIGYALVGPSRILVLGPDSSLGPMIAATILPLVGANGDPAKAILLASALAILTGADHDRRRSRPPRLRRRPAVQADDPRLHERPRADHPRRTAAEAARLLGGRRRLHRRGRRRRPGHRRRRGRAGLRGHRPGVPRHHDRARTRAAEGPRRPRRRRRRDRPEHRARRSPSAASPSSGRSTQGLPQFTFPSVGFSDLSLLVVGALGISLVALADTISTATSFAERQGVEVDGNREMIGIGTANIAAGLFQGFPVSTSGSRTAVAEKAGIAHAAHRARGRRDDRADADRLPRPARRPAPADPRRRRHRRLDLARRPAGDPTPVPAAARRLRRSPWRRSSAWSCSACSPASSSPSSCRWPTCSAASGGRTARPSATWTGSPASTT